MMELSIAIAQDLLDDLNERNAYNDLWDEIDLEIRKQMLNDWTDIIFRGIETVEERIAAHRENRDAANRVADREVLRATSYERRIEELRAALREAQIIRGRSVLVPSIELEKLKAELKEKREFMEEMLETLRKIV